MREDGKPDIILAHEKGFNNYAKKEDENVKLQLIGGLRINQNGK